MVNASAVGDGEIGGSALAFHPEQEAGRSILLMVTVAINSLPGGRRRHAARQTGSIKMRDETVVWYARALLFRYE